MEVNIENIRVLAINIYLFYYFLLCIIKSIQKFPTKNFYDDDDDDDDDVTCAFPRLYHLVLI